MGYVADLIERADTFLAEVWNPGVAQAIRRPDPRELMKGMSRHGQHLVATAARSKDKRKKLKAAVHAAGGEGLKALLAMKK